MCAPKAAFPLIGTGGIDSGETALAKIRAGACLVQIYSSAGVPRARDDLVSYQEAHLAAELRRGAHKGSPHPPSARMLPR